jgi:hypothetical protein
MARTYSNRNREPALVGRAAGVKSARTCRAVKEARPKEGTFPLLELQPRQRANSSNWARSELPGALRLALGLLSLGFLASCFLGSSALGSAAFWRLAETAGHPPQRLRDTLDSRVSPDFRA